jgi:hypothetical protein
MFAIQMAMRRRILGTGALVAGMFGIIATLLPIDSLALPLFARQTGQNCVSCHAGGQFPELTAYGRKFKLTGYTMGERATVPLAVMGVVSSTRIDNTSNGGFSSADFPNNGKLEFTTMSVLCCGKITDNLGVFAQWTYDVYDHQNDQGTWVSHPHMDQFDLRYADRFINSNSDLIFGVSLNNNPGVTDVWNTHNAAFTPVPTYVPAANSINYGNPANPGSNVPMDVPFTPFIVGEGQVAGGLTAYAFWNNTVYAELGFYRNVKGVLSFMNDPHYSDIGYPNKIQGSNPYWRLAYNKDWGANSAMIGLHGMNADSYWFNNDINDNPTIQSSSMVKYRDIGIDGQYQYILDPHVVTAMFSYTHEKQSYPSELLTGNGGTAADNSSDTLNYLRLKGTYVYKAKYGASLAYTSITGSNDQTLWGSANGVPNSRLWAPEVFWMPVQYVRVGLQYYKWDKYLGAKTNYNGDSTNPRDAKDNNSLFFYVWGAY